MKIKTDEMLEELTFSLPDAGSDGFAESGDEPVISVYNDFEQIEVPLINLIIEGIEASSDEETKEKTIEWLTDIIDRLKKMG